MTHAPDVPSSNKTYRITGNLIAGIASEIRRNHGMTESSKRSLSANSSKIIIQLVLPLQTFQPEQNHYSEESMSLKKES